MNKLAKIVIIAILILPLALSNNIISIDQYITEDLKTINNITITLKEKDISMVFNKELYNLKILEGSDKVNCNLFEKNSIICEVLNISDLPISFKISVETDKIVDEKNRYEFKLLTKAERFYISIFLPIGYAVKEEKEEIAENITFLSDGKRIILFVRKNNITTFELSFTLKKIEKIIPLPYSIITIIVIASLIIIAILYLYYKIKLEKERKKIIEVLDINERKVLEILMKNNPINQKKLVELTQLSKAKISKIISSFKQRGIVSVEKRGRNNIIYLNKKL
ncbi:MAG: winged helix-turn-helix transcriptional regulator [Candidatus Aenigmarchaeota archaeon]|nr:winged helix-turn-helix transcriptional regulator [Candidatus Aenigmarchaeota archaeon]